jgi:hypothetical protein
MTLVLEYCDDVQESSKLTTSTSFRPSIPAALNTKAFWEYVVAEAARTGKRPGDVLAAEIKAHNELQNSSRWPSPDALNAL